MLGTIEEEKDGPESETEASTSSEKSDPFARFMKSSGEKPKTIPADKKAVIVGVSKYFIHLLILIFESFRSTIVGCRSPQILTLPPSSSGARKLINMLFQRYFCSKKPIFVLRLVQLKRNGFSLLQEQF